MPLIQDSVRTEIKKRFEALDKPVKIVNFTQEFECAYCRETRELAEEICSLSDKLSIDVYDFVADEAEVAKYKVNKIPSIVLVGDKDTGIRYYGIPTGYEFGVLIEDLIMVSKRDSGLDPGTRKKLAGLSDPLHLQVFVTPTCPYCPRAVVQAFRMAMESPSVTASMVEATEFPHLANKYQVSGVPHTVIGDSAQPMIGAYPEAAALDLILNAVA